MAIFNYKIYKPLEYLENKKIGKLPVLDIDHESAMFSEIFIALGDIFKKSIGRYSESTFFVTKPFFSAFEKAAPSLENLILDMAEKDFGDIKFSGTFIIDDKVFFIDFEMKEGEDEMIKSLCVFHKNGAPLMFYESGYLDGSHFGWVSKYYEQSEQFNPQGGEDYSLAWFNKHFLNLATLHMFINYANVDTIEVCRAKKVLFNKQKYFNQTNSNITILDSTWFTNIVRSEGFSVSGHFRLQPKKINGQWTKELIWINEFQKTGYTIKAKKITSP